MASKQDSHHFKNEGKVLCTKRNYLIILSLCLSVLFVIVFLIIRFTSPVVMNNDSQIELVASGISDILQPGRFDTAISSALDGIGVVIKILMPLVMISTIVKFIITGNDAGFDIVGVIVALCGGLIFFNVFFGDKTTDIREDIHNKVVMFIMSGDVESLMDMYGEEGKPLKIAIDNDNQDDVSNLTLDDRLLLRGIILSNTKATELESTERVGKLAKILFSLQYAESNVHKLKGLEGDSYTQVDYQIFDLAVKSGMLKSNPLEYWHKQFKEERIRYDFVTKVTVSIFTTLILLSLILLYTAHVNTRKLHLMIKLNEPFL